MKGSKKGYSTIDEYIAGCPKYIQAILETVRQAIRESAPKSEERISYGIPTFDLNDRHLVHFAAHKNHIGFYPTSSGVAEFRNELLEYEISKGTIRFPLDKPIALDLVEKIVKFRVKENMAKRH
jgi:uncharacterized protein YdhG (YjbR/CyaY superfamily)